MISNRWDLPRDVKTLLIFPPGWSPFAPYLALPLLKGVLENNGFEIDIRDFNMEFFDWILSRDTLLSMIPRLHWREKQGKARLGSDDYARVCRSILNIEKLAARIENAKAAMRDPARYQNDFYREESKTTIAAALHAVSSAFTDVDLSTRQIYFRNCGLDHVKIERFAPSDDNLIRVFYRQWGRSLIEVENYDLIGMSLACWEQLTPALSLARAIRDEGFGGHICFGGNYTTRMVKMWEGKTAHYRGIVDSFSLYEGEESLLELVEVLGSGGDLRTVPNLASFEGGHLRLPVRKKLGLDDLPTPSFNGFPLEKYMLPKLILPVFSSRGCNHQCAFCSIPYASGTFKSRPLEAVVDDIQRLTQNYATRYFTFVDELLTSSTLQRISDLFIERALDIRWYGETRFHPKLDDLMARRLYDSGCRKLQFGLESYNQRVLNLMRKGTKIINFLPNIEACLNNGIAVHLFSIIGFPGETREEALNTRQFCLDVLALSDQTLGPRYSSVGMSPYRFSFFSDIHFHPERYGVEIVDCSEDGEPLDILTVDYLTQSGLSSDDAERMVKGFHENVPEGCHSFIPADLPVLDNDEEEGFLLKAMTDLPADYKTLPSTGLPPKRLVKPDSDLRINLSVHAKHYAFEADFLTGREPLSGDTFSVFYSVGNDNFVSTPTVQAKKVLSACGGERIPPSVFLDNHDLLHLLDRLLFNGLIEVQGRGVYEHDAAVDVRACDGKLLLLALDPNVVLECRDQQKMHLFNVVTREVIILSASMAWLISLFENGARLVDDLFEEAAAKQPRLTRSLFDDALNRLAAVGAVSLLPLGRSEKDGLWDE